MQAEISEKRKTTTEKNEHGIRFVSAFRLGDQEHKQTPEAIKSIIIDLRAYRRILVRKILSSTLKSTTNQLYQYLRIPISWWIIAVSRLPIIL